jgi:hypothetical protein
MSIVLNNLFSDLGIINGNTEAKNQYDFYNGIVWNDNEITYGQYQFFNKLGINRREFFNSYSENERDFYSSIDDTRIVDYYTYYKYAGEYLGQNIPTPTYITEFDTLTGSWTTSTDSYFVGGKSWYFTGGYGQINATTDIDIPSSSDFTVEMFVKQTTSTPFTRLMTIGPHLSKFAWYLSGNDGNNFYLAFNNAWKVFSVQTNFLNTWKHYAIVRKDNVIKLYVDGVADAITFTDSAAVTTGSDFITIPALPDGSFGANGYFSNFRWTLSAVYDGNFTPATSNLSGLPDTKVLLITP